MPLIAPVGKVYYIKHSLCLPEKLKHKLLAEDIGDYTKARTNKQIKELLTKVTALKLKIILG